MTEFVGRTDEELSMVEANDPCIDFHNYSFEEELAKYEGVDDLGVGAYRIIIRIFVPPKMTKTAGGIIRTDGSVAKDVLNNKHTQLVGLVIKLGELAYKDPHKWNVPIEFADPKLSEKEYELYDNPLLPKAACKAGDWVFFNRSYGSVFSVKKMATIAVFEDDVVMRVKDPTIITRLT